MVMRFGRSWHGEPPLSCAWGNPGLSPHGGVLI
jgi:hypothetical protein